MSSMDVLNSSLYFSSVANASREAQKNQDKQKVDKTKKPAFSSMMQKSQEIQELASEGFPVEIAGMSVEEAVVFLKDAVDSSADKLNDFVSAENFAEFRKSVSSFLKYVEKNNYEISKKKRFGKSYKKGVYFEEVRPKDPYYQIHVINTELDKLATMVMQNHSDKLALMSKVDEIKGLVVDFLAV